MKLKKLWLGLAIILGTFIIGGQQAKADTISNGIGNYASGNQPIEIYSDASLTKLTGKTLNTSFDLWKIIRMNTKSDGSPISYDLGNNDWVAVDDQIEIENGSNGFQELFSAGHSFTLYKDPLGKQPIGKLDATISDWAITKIGRRAGTEIVRAIDLGDNQWVVNMKGGDLILGTYHYKQGISLVNSAGEPTSTISSSMNYHVFGAKEINGQVYLKLGSDQQWANINDSTIYLSAT